MAYRRLTAIADRVRTFFERYDLLALPVAQVPPFPVEEEYPATVAGRPQASYLDWMRSAYLITVTGCPAISVPAGFTPQGGPVGIQLVAAPRVLPDLGWAGSSRAGRAAVQPPQRSPGLAARAR